MVDKKKVIKGLLIEKRYNDAKMKGLSHKSLVKSLNSIGYNSIKEFTNDKIALYIEDNIFSRINVDLSNLDSEMSEILTSSNNEYAVIDVSDLTVLANNSDMINEVSAHESGAKVMLSDIIPSCIVMRESDILFGLCVGIDSLIDRDVFMNKLVSIFTEAGLQNVSRDRNDILIDGKKVCGTVTVRSSQKYLNIGFISFNSDSDIVKDICTKESMKEPSFIDPMYKDKVIEGILKWLQ